MSTQTQQGYFVIGDISGFTSYVARTELQHSQEILTELLELIVRQMRPVLQLVKFEGDAVFAYVSVTDIGEGDRLVDLVEATYMAFRNRVMGIQARTTCTCNACRALPSLDLKFFTHFGEYMVQQISGTTDLVGSAVNLLHRLTKNHVTDETGWNAYALFTASALEQMGVEAGEMHALVENYEHLGDVQTYSLDLHKRYKELTEAGHVRVKPEEADSVVSFIADAPPAILWHWLTNPGKRSLVDDTTVWKSVTRPGGRTGAGATNHCAHGSGEITVENILDWRPYETYTIEMIAKIDKSSAIDHVATSYLEPVEDGQKTHIIAYYQLKNRSILTKVIFKLIWPVGFKRYLRKVESSIQAEARRQASPSVVGN